jgi:DNA-binding IclR family transcriptional regulator
MAEMTVEQICEATGLTSHECLKVLGELIRNGLVDADDDIKSRALAAYLSSAGETT